MRSRVSHAPQVEDPATWHAANLARNRRHYSALGALGPRAVAGVAECVGVGVHFNPFVRLPGVEAAVKYGVVGLPRLLRDLREWDALFVAGRLQKPVATLAGDARVDAAQASNLRAALACALLLLPERFSEQQLHVALCGLSYNGDVRMALAEDAAKVERIAQGSAAQLRRLYQDAVARAAAWSACLVRAPGVGQRSAVPRCALSPGTRALADAHAARRRRVGAGRRAARAARAAGGAAARAAGAAGARGAAAAARGRRGRRRSCCRRRRRARAAGAAARRAGRHGARQQPPAGAGGPAHGGARQRGALCRAQGGQGMVEPRGRRRVTRRAARGALL
jgi:hypothetical protein